jgi:hypothetical protein
MVKNVLTGADRTRLHDGIGGGTDGVVAENAAVMRIDQVVSRMRAQETAIGIKQRHSVMVVALIKAYGISVAC